MEDVQTPCEEVINSMVPIGLQRDKDEVTKEESDEFYENLYYELRLPAATIASERRGQVTYKALLFIPGCAPTNFFSATSLSRACSSTPTAS